MQTTHWPSIPRSPLQLRQRWKWSTRPSMSYTCHTSPPCPFVAFSPSALPFYLSLSLSHATFCYAVELWHPSAVILLLPLLSSVWLWGFLIMTAAYLYVVPSIQPEERKPMYTNFSAGVNSVFHTCNLPQQSTPNTGHTGSNWGCYFIF